MKKYITIFTLILAGLGSHAVVDIEEIQNMDEMSKEKVQELVEKFDSYERELIITLINNFIDRVTPAENDLPPAQEMKNERAELQSINFASAEDVVILAHVLFLRGFVKNRVDIENSAVNAVFDILSAPIERQEGISNNFIANCRTVGKLFSFTDYWSSTVINQSGDDVRANPTRKYIVDLFHKSRASVQNSQVELIQNKTHNALTTLFADVAKEDLPEDQIIDYAWKLATLFQLSYMCSADYIDTIFINRINEIKENIREEKKKKKSGFLNFAKAKFTPQSRSTPSVSVDDVLTVIGDASWNQGGQLDNPYIYLFYYILRGEKPTTRMKSANNS